MKTAAKTKRLRTPKKRRTSARKPATAQPQQAAEEFRRQLHIDLAEEIAASQREAKARFPELFRTPTPAEIKARVEATRAMFAQWAEEARKNPPTAEEIASYDRMLERMERERAS